MNDDLTPPPEQPLDAAARARIRERVVSGLDDRTPRRPWLVPIAAAAAVVALAGVTGYVALGPDDQNAPADPGGQGTATPSPDDASEVPSDVPSEAPSEPPPDDPMTTCAEEVRGVLRGAEEMASIEDEAGATTFYVAGDRYTLCDTHGGRATVHHPKPLTGGGDRNPYELSTVFPDGRRAVLVAGGPVPAGSSDFSVSYEFGDGHVEDAAIIGSGADGADGGSGASGVDGAWWLMVYDDADGSAATGGVITVDVRGGAPGDGPLDVLDTCAQANHGC